MLDFQTENLRKIYDTNVIGLALFTREVVQDMQARGVNDGHIFHINRLLLLYWEQKKTYKRKKLIVIDFSTIWQPFQWEKIIFSISGQYVIQYPGMYAYSASKHAVTVMTEGLRRELRDLKTNIRVTVNSILLLFQESV
jgi:NAD(P)-dependent dehydrogenase (short-subunit alcohol dehydrogenase family)